MTLFYGNGQLRANGTPAFAVAAGSGIDLEVVAGVATISSTGSAGGLDFSDPALLWYAPDGYQAGLCERHFSTSSTSLTCTVRFTTSLGVDSANEVLVLVDGVPRYLTWDGVSGQSDGAFTVVTFTIELYPGMHEVILRDGPANSIGWPNNISVLGKHLGVTGNAAIYPIKQPQPKNAVVIVADSVGQGIQATHPTRDGYVSKLRDAHSLDASISVVGGGGEAIGYAYARDATMGQLARCIAAQCVGIESNRVFIQLGINDAVHNLETSAEFGTRLGLLIDALRRLVPKAEIIVASQTLIAADAYAAWRNAVVTACGSRKYTRYVSGATQTPIAAWAPGGLHPTTEQYAVLYECIESILGLCTWGTLTQSITSLLPDDHRNKLSNSAMMRAYDQGTEQPFVQSSAALQPPIHSPNIDSVNDGPAGCAYIQTTLAGAQSLLSTFAAARVRCTILLCLRFDGAAGTKQDVLSGDVTNTCTLQRSADGSIQYYSNGFGTLSAVTPVGWHVYEISRWDTASYCWAKIDGGAEVEFVYTQASIGGVQIGKQAGGGYPANASYAEIAVVVGDPSEAPTARGRLTNAVGRARFIRHCQARYNITVAA